MEHIVKFCEFCGTNQRLCRRLTYDQVATGRKSALMSVIGCRTDETDLGGVMEEAEGYENLHVFSELKQ
jgi:hypothetical protein